MKKEQVPSLPLIVREITGFELKLLPRAVSALQRTRIQGEVCMHREPDSVAPF